MKKHNFYLSAGLAVIVASCAHQYIEKSPDVVLAPKKPDAPVVVTPVVVTPVEPKIEVPKKQWKTPRYEIAPTQIDTADYKEAVKLLTQYANTDEFIAYVSYKRKYFSHTEMSVNEALGLFRKQLDEGKLIQVTFYTPWFSSNVLGGWDGETIEENTKFDMTPIERAGHLLHETSHVYGWVHQGNYVNQNDNTNSFPYAIGYDFEDFLQSKVSSEVAKK